ncbi:GTPase [Crocosphaera sp. UHCC 0190]|uniref:GTPase n=1 Tax=Crocosphaera sp. UHCC 0190 TaxID=3110246 RepID=UPI002B20A1B1|nr:GTPase [Crocosphaera sp. UHCC 0190]MEA5510334.1 GTPase [Crocosphaera sp. UHCC 0190]
MSDSVNSTNGKLDYSLLLLTHLISADQQIHNKELQYLQQIENSLMIDPLTREEKEKILSQDETMLSVEAVAKQVLKSQRDRLLKQLLTLTHIDEFYSPLEHQMIEKIGKIWGLDELKIQYLLDSYSSQFSHQVFSEDRTDLKGILGNDPAYHKALDQCAEIAKEDYKFTKSALKQTQTILEQLRQGIKRQLKSHQSYDERGQGTTEKEVIKQLEGTEELLNNEIIKATNQVVESLHAKERALKYFTIAFMGRTKAGKSTLHAIMTGEGWEGIGVGKQRTTRLNRVYEWQNIRIIDTPGIGAPGGKSDEEIAQTVIDEADVICYVVTNDSIQETEFQFLQQLKEKAKPLIVLLNIKHNLRDDRRLQHFLQNPDKVFAKEGKNGLEGHISRIRRYAKEHYSNDYFPIIPVMLLAAQISQETYDKK